MGKLFQFFRSWLFVFRMPQYFDKVALSVALFGCAFIYFTQITNPYKYFNSDALTIYVFIDDFIQHAGHYSAWHFSNAPSFLPDYIIGLAAYFLAKSTYWQIFLSGLIQLGLLFYVIHRLTAPLLNIASKTYALAATLFISLLASKDISPYYQSMILNWHFGTYLIGLYYLLIYVDLIDQSASLHHSAARKCILPLCLLSFGMTLSDALFIVIFPGALLLIGGYFVFQRRIGWRAFFFLFALPLIAGLIGHEVAPKLIPHFVNLPFRLSPPEILASKWHDLFQLLSQLGFTSLLLLLIACGLSWKLITCHGVSAVQPPVNRSEQIKCFLLLFFFVSLMANVTVVIATNVLVGDRYLPSIFFGPIIFVFLISINFFKKIHLIRCGLLLMTIAYLQVVWVHRHESLKLNYYPEQIACIDNVTRKLPAPSGIGEYWLTKKLVAFSKTGVRMVSVNPDLTPYRVLISDDWYQERYNFAVINTAEPAGSMYLLREKLIEDFNGPPDRVAYCENAKILLYERGLKTEMDPERGTGIYSAEGCRLPRTAGLQRNNNTCSVQLASTNYSGNLTYGPYFKLPAGQYEFDLNYVSQNPINQLIGHIDNSFLLPEGHQVINKMNWFGSDGKPAHLKGVVSIDPSLARGQFELRTFVLQHTDVEILSIQVRPLQQRSKVGDKSNEVTDRPAIP